MWTYRRMLKLIWTEKVKNGEVLEGANIKKRLYNIVQTKKLQYFGHIICQSGDTLHHTVLDGKVLEQLDSTWKTWNKVDNITK